MNTPETDQNIVEIGFDENNNPCQFVTAEFARQLERERDEAREALENYIASTVHSCNDECKRPMCVLRRERDEAQNASEAFSALAWKLEGERNEAREDATNYYARIGELESERDELKKIVEQRILVGAEIHNKANSLLKQSNRTEVECEALRKQLTAATSALRQIHLEVGDWIRSTIIVEE